MLGTGHHWTGALTGIACAGLAHRLGVIIPIWVLPLIVVAGWYGGTAPDHLEMSRGWFDGGKWRSTTVIPHRTITHVLALWLLADIACVAAFHQPGFPYPLLLWPLLAFFLGGTVHILVDWPNPMGVPILVPNKRHSLRLWRSGEYEIPIILVFATVAWACWGFVH